jgi:peptidoglycan hydrolase-like protein with peptidoglycan-binding domain
VSSNRTQNRIHKEETMTTTRRLFTPVIGVVLTLLLATTTGIAQTRLTIPSGSVLEMRTEAALASDTSHPNDVFNSTVTKSLYIDGAIAVPENSTVRGRVTSVTPAARREPGIIGVAFDQITIDGRSYVIDGTLTSLDPKERKQIIEQEGVKGGSTTKRDVVFIGGGAGAGAVVGAIAGGGKGAGIGAAAGGALGVLGALLSSGKQAKVEAGSMVAMEILRPVTLTSNDRITRNRGANDRSVYTAAAMVRNAQTELKRRNYYSGVVNGQLDDSTRRSIAHFQIDNGQPATGDLDESTLGTLGVMQGQGRGRGLAAVDTRQLSLELSQKATSLLTVYQSSLGLRANGGFAGVGSRLYSEADLKLLLDVNAFSTAATWYEQASRQGNSNSPSLDNLGRILASSARDVETSMQAASQNTQFRDSWVSIRADLRRLRLDGQLSNR